VLDGLEALLPHRMTADVYAGLASIPQAHQ
jgi:hypothetical protein